MSDNNFKAWQDTNFYLVATNRYDRDEFETLKEAQDEALNTSATRPGHAIRIWSVSKVGEAFTPISPDTHLR